MQTGHNSWCAKIKYECVKHHSKNISEDTQEMPQSRSTALPRHHKEERGQQKRHIWKLRRTKKNYNRGTAVVRSPGKLLGRGNLNLCKTQIITKLRWYKVVESSMAIWSQSKRKAHIFFSFLSFFLSLHTAIHPLRYSRQMYIVHSGLQDEGLQVTISNYRRVL